MMERFRALALITGAVMVVTLAGCDQLKHSPQPTSSATVRVTLAPPPTTTTQTPMPSTTPLGPLSGTWSGTWNNTSPITAVGKFTLAWAQQGDKLYGALSVTGSNCLRAGNVTGSVSGNRLSFGAVDGDTSIDYDATIVDNNTLSGTYHTACGNSAGTWTASRST
jgi:hypothetical protein